jgi:hypothetical protein
MNLADPVFADADKAPEHLEKSRWPNGPICSHCGVVNDATYGKAARKGVYQCTAAVSSSASRPGPCSKAPRSRLTSGYADGEYVREGHHHSNTVENLKRGITGTFHHVSEAHLNRYLAEFDLRYSHRPGLCVDDIAIGCARAEGVSIPRTVRGGTDLEQAVVRRWKTLPFTLSRVASGTSQVRAQRGIGRGAFAGFSPGPVGFGALPRPRASVCAHGFLGVAWSALAHWRLLGTTTGSRNGQFLRGRQACERRRPGPIVVGPACGQLVRCPWPAGAERSHSRCYILADAPASEDAWARSTSAWTSTWPAASSNEGRRADR